MWQDRIDLFYIIIMADPVANLGMMMGFMGVAYVQSHGLNCHIMSCTYKVPRHYRPPSIRVTNAQLPVLLCT